MNIFEGKQEKLKVGVTKKVVVSAATREQTNVYIRTYVRTQQFARNKFYVITHSRKELITT